MNLENKFLNREMMDKMEDDLMEILSFGIKSKDIKEEIEKFFYGAVELKDFSLIDLENEEEEFYNTLEVSFSMNIAGTDLFAVYWLDIDYEDDDVLETATTAGFINCHIGKDKKAAEDFQKSYYY